MKSFFENNRTYFEKQGLAQKLKKQDMKGPFCSPFAGKEMMIDIQT